MTENKQERDKQKRKGELEREEEEYVEVVPVDEEERKGEDYLLEEELPLDKLAVDERSEGIVEQQIIFTDEESVEKDLEKRQKYAYGGRKEIEEELEEHHHTSPDMAAGDVDADWKGADTGSGAETVGGTEPTPDQDVVDELGEAVGITYDDDEPLNIEKKMKERREKRLEPREEEGQLPPREEQRDQDEGE